MILTTKRHVSETQSRLHYYFEDRRQTRISLYNTAPCVVQGYYLGMSEVKSNMRKLSLSSTDVIKSTENLTLEALFIALFLFKHFLTI